MTKKVNTMRLIHLLLNNHRLFEVRLIINDLFTATHFIYTIDDLSFFDEGIDGEIRHVDFIDFVNEYKNKEWLIDNII